MLGSRSLRCFREDLVAGRIWKEEHAREKLYDMDICIRMYYRIILLLQVYHNSQVMQFQLLICSERRLYNFCILKLPNLVSVKFNPSMKLLKTPKQ